MIVLLAMIVTGAAEPEAARLFLEYLLRGFAHGHGMVPSVETVWPIAICSVA